jgi:nitrite reductase/ring-hydroxylating ferredoxin subunit
VKALHNACRHRATQLAKGCGRLPGGQIVCPFHGWRGDLDGSSSFVFMDSSFDPSCLEPEELRLRECLVEVWSGMVWINMDLGARPLREALAPVADLLDGVGVGNMRVKMLPMYGNCLSYRIRPYKDDPQWCLFDVWSLTTYPEGQEPERAELVGIFDKEDAEHWGLIPRQDFSNIERQQHGLNSPSYVHHRLSMKFERGIANMHEELDRVIASRL